MNALSIPSSLSIRVATMSDLPFMDSLQKKHSKQLGYFPRKQFEGYIEQGAVLIAEEATERRSDGATKGDELGLPSVASSLRRSTPGSVTPLGYCISKDRYLKRDELGVIYQLCVVPGEQRKLVGAALIKEVFARSAYGCKLYCCWCAQDIAANYFWESLGFLPIAFRAGGKARMKAEGGRMKRKQANDSSFIPPPSCFSARVHIFWQRRINAEDGVTPYWYPSQTNSGAIREDRLVFPIPPGTHWKEVEAVKLPSDEATKRRSDEGKTKVLPNPRSAIRNPKSNANPKSIARNGLWFAGGQKAEVRDIVPRDQKSEVSGKDGAGSPHLTSDLRPLISRPKQRIDPRLVSAARELRDRYLEQINERGGLEGGGKYDVSRIPLKGRGASAVPLLPAA